MKTFDTYLMESNNNKESVMTALKKYKGKALNADDVEKIVFSNIKNVDEAEDILVDVLDNPSNYGIKIKK